MSKFQEVDGDVQSLFEQVLNATSIPQWLEFRVMYNDKQTEIYKVVKANDLWEALSDGVNFAVVLNLVIFNELQLDQKLIVFEEALSGVLVNSEDKITVEKPDFSTYSGLLQKYGADTMIRLKETVKSLFDKKKAEEDQAKAAISEKKKKKKDFGS